MAIFEPETLTNPLFPTFFIYRFLGTGIIAYPAGRAKRILGLIYSLIICISVGITFLVSYLDISSLAQSYGSPIAVFGHYIFHFLKFGLTIYHIVLSIIRYKEDNECFMELMEIRAAIKEMGISCSYHSRLMHRIWQLLGSMLIFVGIICCDLSYIYLYSITNKETSGLVKVIAAWYFFQSSEFISTFVGISFCTFNRMMTFCLKDLNTFLKSMRIKHPSDYDTRMGNLIRVDAILEDKQKLEKLQCIRKIHYRLMNLAQRWTELNGLNIVVSIIFATFLSTINTYNVYSIFIDFDIQMLSTLKALRLSAEIIFHFMKLYIVICPATALLDEARRTCEILLRHLQPIAFLRLEVHEFSLQLIQNPLRLRACGLFDLDYSLIHMVITTAATYMVVLVQTQSVHNFNRSLHPLNSSLSNNHT